MTRLPAIALALLLPASAGAQNNVIGSVSMPKCSDVPTDFSGICSEGPWAVEKLPNKFVITLDDARQICERHVASQFTFLKGEINRPIVAYEPAFQQLCGFVINHDLVVQEDQDLSALKAFVDAHEK